MTTTNQAAAILRDRILSMTGFCTYYTDTARAGAYVEGWRAGVKQAADVVEADATERAAIQPAGDAIYQLAVPSPRSGGKVWHDVAKSEHDASPQCVRRIVYTHPAAPVQAAPDDTHQLLKDCQQECWKRGARIAELEAVQAAPELTVWYGSMPESNGKSNFTATLKRKDHASFGGVLTSLTNGYCFSRSEYPERVRYEADCMRFLIGEIEKKPHILDYDADKHSGYVAPAVQAAPVGSGKVQPFATWLAGAGHVANVGHKFLKWNRALEKPVVEISKELYVARKVLELAAPEVKASELPSIGDDAEFGKLLYRYAAAIYHGETPARADAAKSAIFTYIAARSPVAAPQPDDPQLDACNQLLSAAHEFWNACKQAKQYGAVQWLEGDDGSLLIFTRSEYRETLMKNIHDTDTVTRFIAPQPDVSARDAALEEAHKMCLYIAEGTSGDYRQACYTLASSMQALKHEMFSKSRAAPESAEPSAIDAANYIDTKANVYLNNHADQDPDTGCTVFHYGEAGRDYHSSLVELAEEIRILATSSAAKGAQ